VKLPHTVTVITPRRITDDEYGNTEVPRWDPPAATRETKGMFQPRVGQENEAGGDIQIGDGVLYLPAGDPVNGSERVQVLGSTWEVIGPPEIWSTGSLLDHVRATLRRVEG
jgi:hypothetical protein